MYRAVHVFHVVFVVCTACQSHSLVAVDPSPRGEVTGRFSEAAAPKLDLLFVIDNSGSMEKEQSLLRRGFQDMMRAFEQGAGAALDLHVAVVSTDVGAGNASSDDACSARVGGDRGRFHAGTDCGLEAGASFLAASPGGTRNFGGSLAEAFSCVADLGTKGCGYEHPLLALALALDPSRTPENAGFLREDAFLGVVIVSDEDDCSAPPESDFFAAPFVAGQEPDLRCALAGHLCEGRSLPSRASSFSIGSCAAAPDGGGRLFGITTLVEALTARKAGRTDRIFVSVLAGWPEPETARYQLALGSRELLQLSPACKSGEGIEAAPALRLKAFAEAFGRRGRFDTICRADFTPVLEDIGKGWGGELRPRCLAGTLADTDPGVPGVQPHCVVNEVRPGPSGPQNSALPACSGANAPCWAIVTAAGPMSLCEGGGSALEIRRSSPAPEGATVSVACELCLDPNDPACGESEPESE
ncbi:MAG: hypothetical protein KA712_08495 [Myxococcales bacterium]|nr:hypothetical protein [Myxococcales bacterium]